MTRTQAVELLGEHLGRESTVGVTVRSGHRSTDQREIIVGRVVGFADRIAGTAGGGRALDVVFREVDTSRPSGFKALHTTFAASRVLAVVPVPERTV